MSKGTLHEEVTRHEETRGSSDRSFGLVFAGAFVVLPLIAWWRGGALRLWPFGVAAVFLLLALARPAWLAPLNRLWTRLGLLISRVTNPIMMGVIFFLVVTPVALLVRLRGKDPLRLERDPAAKSYWILREPPGPLPETMSEQF
jgi:hypothetical protein